MRSFASDNNSSVHPRIMEALMKANNGHALGYGEENETAFEERASMGVAKRVAAPFPDLSKGLLLE